jgi:hypothetical protein
MAGALLHAAVPAILLYGRFHRPFQ